MGLPNSMRIFYKTAVSDKFEVSKKSLEWIVNTAEKVRCSPSKVTFVIE
jgi:hypothetical protein